MLIELLVRSAQPPPTARGTIDDLLGHQPHAEQRALILIHRRRDRLAHRQRIVLGLLASALAFFIEFAFGLLERRSTTLRGAQVLGQLIAARLRKGRGGSEGEDACS